MFQYFTRLFSNFVFLIIALGVALANWQWPLYLWLGDTPVYRFIWLAIFFIVLDIFIEIIFRSAGEIRLVTENMGFSRDVHKLSKSFHLISKVSLPNNLKADYVAIGSSGIWLIDVKDGDGVVTFNGDELVQKDIILNGLITKVLEKSYAMSDFLKKQLNRDFKVAPVVAFSSSRAKLSSVPKSIKNVFITSRVDTVALIENTDFQLTDNNTIEEIYKILKNKK